MDPLTSTPMVEEDEKKEGTESGEAEAAKEETKTEEKEGEAAEKAE